MRDRHDPRQVRRTRRRRSILTATAAAAIALLTLGAAHAAGSAAAAPPDHARNDGAHQPPGTIQRDIAAVRGAVARYHTPERAEAAGWGLVPGLDHCFDNPGVGGMGYHHIDTDQLGDPTLDPLHPEALVFVEGPNGQLRLGAVEYIVPVDLWEGDDPPSVLGRDLHELEPVPGVHVWGLHVWLIEPNPDGIFADWNPRVGCST